MSKFYNQYKSTINVVVGVAAIGIGYGIYQHNKKAKELAKANAAAQLANSELSQLAAQGVTPSYSDSQFIVFVDSLVQAMSGCGTDENTIYNVFRSMRNDADIRKLISLFGVQFYQPCAWTSPVSYAIWQVNDQAYGGGLSTWLSYDLSAGAIQDINEILNGNGVNYQF